MSTCLPFNCVVAFPDVFTYMVDLFESVAKITVLHIDQLINGFILESPSCMAQTPRSYQRYLVKFREKNKSI